MSTEVDALTPVDQAPGNVVRLPSQKLPVFSGLLIWSRAAGRPVWTAIPTPPPTAPSAAQDYVEAGYVDDGYFL